MNAGNLGDSLNCKVYVVGGFVRDLILNRPNDDIDLVIEGDGIRYADALAEVRTTRTSLFGTLTKFRSMALTRLCITDSS